MAFQHRGALQNTFLNRLRKSHTSATVHLLNGVRLRGTVAGFDEFCICLMVSGSQQLVFKHAISTIIPVKPVGLADPDESKPRDPDPESPVG